MQIFDQIEEKYGWRIRKPPTAMDGGFLHRMYRLETDQGAYALKLLNPFIMRRETAMSNYAEAERLEALLERNGIPILPALSINGRKMQEIEGQYFYLFRYYDGRALKRGETTEEHCGQMGRVLGRIHSIDRRTTGMQLQEKEIDWDFYFRETEKVDRDLGKRLKAHARLIKESQEKGGRAGKKLPGILTICHNDMDCKNVLWRGKEYRIIDLECLSYSHPWIELFELALSWSGYGECEMDVRLFVSFLQGYAAGGGRLPEDWETLYDCNNGRLEWLEYNLKRVLGIDCGENEREMGRRQAEQTIEQIAYYAKMRERILESCWGIV